MSRQGQKLGRNGDTPRFPKPPLGANTYNPKRHGRINVEFLAHRAGEGEGRFGLAVHVLAHAGRADAEQGGHLLLVEPHLVHAQPDGVDEGGGPTG